MAPEEKTFEMGMGKQAIETNLRFMDLSISKLLQVKHSTPVSKWKPTYVLGFQNKYK
jgi:hypothetical protein